MDSKTDKYLKKFGENLQKLREDREISTRKFADLADISHSSVGRLEAGETNPTLTTLIKLADALGVTIDTLAMR
ncbi:MAG TPA: helix-turn-helix transcriptional regulator [Puia sp.]|nr:helix-turn-helix transcriptional regulator [Puia sp.]